MIKEKIKKQLSELKSDCTYNAETHHTIADRSKRIDFWARVTPATITAILSVAKTTLSDVSETLTILILVSAVITAVTNTLGAYEKYTSHLVSAKKFTKLKKLCGKAVEIDIDMVSDVEAKGILDDLYVEYLKVVEEVPETENWAFKKAQTRIQKDKVHEPD